LANNQAHNDLVRSALQELAINGYTAWANQTGVWFDSDGRPHKYGKKGSGDIMIILPVLVQFASGFKRLVGWHIEAEAKTGTGRQSENQNLHQEFCVERNGGGYILFRDVPYLLAELARLKST
jgi:hypothetical protein